MTPERCLELIHQATGTLDEKLECAQMGYWGNVPAFGTPQPVYSWVPVEALPELNPVAYEGRKVVLGKCKSCNCGGSGGSGPSTAAASNWGSPGPSTAAAPASGLSFEFSASGWLIIFVILLVAVAAGRNK